MNARRWPLALLLGVCALHGCGAAEPPFVGELALFGGDRTLVVEGHDGTVSAVARDTGKTRWRFRPPPEPAPSFITLPARHLVCPLERTPAGTLLLRYHTRLLAVDGRTGRLRWERKLVGWATEDRRCVRPTPDSGALLLRGHGLFLQKLDDGGRDGWRFVMGRLGAALAPPQISWPAGDALVRTRDFVASINPEGALNWVRRR